MSASQSAVRSRAEAVAVSRAFDWMILFTLFTAVLGGYHIHYMLTGGDWDFWTDWKDRRLWVTVAPIVSITFPAAVQAMLWYRYRLPIGATVCVLALLLGEWINRYLNFWGWTYFPVNFCFPSNLVPGAIVLDVILMLGGSMTLTAVVGGLAWGLLFYPGNWPIIAPLHVPVEYNGMMFTLADLQGYHYVRTGTPEYIRMVEKGTLRTFGKDVAPVSAFFSGFVSIIIYFLWHFFGRWFNKTDFISGENV